MSAPLPAVEPGAVARPLPPPRAGLRLVAIVLAALLLAMLCAKRAKLTGDGGEYMLMTVALASHGSPDIRPDDIAQGRLLAPFMAPHLATLEQGMRDGETMPLPGFYRGNDGKTYAIHFHAYSALAVLPYQLFRWIGVPPLKCFQAINLAMVFVLGLALLRLFGSAPRALAGVALYMLCGGLLYWNWSSPECLSAAALLAGLVYFLSGAPLRGGLLVGLASLQNPSIVLTLGAVPVLLCCLCDQAAGWRDGVRAALRPRMLLGLALGGALFALPLLFSLRTFGVTSVIAKIGTSAELIGGARLHSLFFDLNQGMIVAVPAVAAMALLWGWRGMDAARRRGRAAALAVCALLMAAYAIPAMMVHNWNSGGAGVMRYAFWSAMPLLFLLFWRLRGEARWPLPLLALVIVVQTAAMAAASRYSQMEFSPLARLVMEWAPGLYHPVPEIFAERAAGAEDHFVDPNKVYAFKVDGVAVKTLYNRANADPGTGLCGAGATMSGGKPVRQRGGWIYLDGPVRCSVPARLDALRFAAGPVVMAGGGWSTLEQPQGQPAGMWSEGERSTLHIAYAAPGRYHQLVFAGQYANGNRRTRVSVNGKDVGWHDLRGGAPVPIPDADAASALVVELRHEAPNRPGPGDGRLLAYFLEQVTLQ